MPAVSVSAFLTALEKSKLLRSQRLKEVADAPPADATELANALVRSGDLTDYQAKQLLAGKYRGFFLGPYKILRPIGRGGMGTVFLAEHTSLSRKVAVKVLPPDKAKDKLSLERFHREARAAAALDHPNIVRLHDISQGNGVHFLVMEYVEGKDLQSLMGQTGPLHYAQAARYVAQAAAGLHHAHEKGFIHRDVKPANLILAKDGVVKILDMGLARTFQDEKDDLTALRGDGDIVGTVDYMSPEQAMNQPLDERSDIYSLGATLYSLVAGHPPFQGTPAQRLAQHQLKEPPVLGHQPNGPVPPQLSAVIARMMAKAKSERPQTAADVMHALGPWLSASTGDAGKPTEATHSESAPGRKANRKRTVLAVGAVVTLLVGGAAVWVGLSSAARPKADTRPTGDLLPTPPPAAGLAPPSVTKPPGHPVVYRWDLSKLSLVRQERPVEETTNQVKAGLLPPGWTFFRSTASTCSPYCEVVPDGDNKAVRFGKVQGEGLVRLSGTFTPPLDKGKTFKLRVQYSAASGFTGDVAVRRGFAELDTPLVAPLPSTDGHWRWVEFVFPTDPDKKAEMLVITNSSGEVIGVTIRALEVLDVTAPPPDSKAP
jgi:serine/threonine protein kinase